ncbi:MAG: efflux RND transporter periplasmic adaptor subunit [Deltaproteobacteria bacterium]|nr:efflux RND transporter periplasmic adaptor subunit [Deltaproteobacteria bacterium]
MLQRSRTFLFTASPAVAAGCALAAVMLAAHGASAQRWGPRPVAVKTAPVQSKAIPQEVSFIGTIEPNVATTVASVVAGRVSAADFREGDAVTAGKTVLLQVDRGRREIALRERAAAVARAKKQWEKVREGSRSEEVAQRLAAAKEQEALLERARRDFERAKRLYGDQLVSLAALQKAESDYLAAREKYGSARAALKLTRSGARAEDIAMAEAEHEEARARMDAVSYEIEKSTLLAPISGFIVRKHVDVGDWVNAGEPVADLVDLDPVYAAGPVGERKIALLRRGQPATVALDAFPGKTFSGEVAYIVPQADTRSRSFPVKIRLSNAQGRLKAGMLARVAVIVSSGKPSVLVPKDAVVRRGPDEMVFVVSDGQAKAVKVSTGRGYRTLLEIADGDLEPGQQVVTLGNEVLRDGAMVQLGNGPGPGGRPGGGRPGGRQGPWAGRPGGTPGSGGRPGGRPGARPGGPGAQRDGNR